MGTGLEWEQSKRLPSGYGATVRANQSGQAPPYDECQHLGYASYSLVKVKNVCCVSACIVYH